MFTQPKVSALFDRHNVYTPKETAAVANVMYERYVLDSKIEGNTMLEMLNQGVLPACAEDLKAYEGTGLAGHRQTVYTGLAAATEALQALMDAWPEDDDVRLRWILSAFCVRAISRREGSEGFHACWLHSSQQHECTYKCNDTLCHCHTPLDGLKALRESALVSFLGKPSSDQTATLYAITPPPGRGGRVRPNRIHPSNASRP
jgi:hypothetical protein